MGHLSNFDRARLVFGDSLTRIQRDEYFIFKMGDPQLHPKEHIFYRIGDTNYALLVQQEKGFFYNREGILFISLGNDQCKSLYLNRTGFRRMMESLPKPISIRILFHLNEVINWTLKY